jgi:hypothetical protein
MHVQVFGSCAPIRFDQRDIHSCWFCKLQLLCEWCPGRCIAVLLALRNGSRYTSLQIFHLTPHAL